MTTPTDYTHDGVTVQFFTGDNPTYPYAMQGDTYQEFETEEKRLAYTNWWIAFKKQSMLRKTMKADYAVLAEAILTYQAHRAACDSMDMMAAALGNVLCSEAETVNGKLER